MIKSPDDSGPLQPGELGDLLYRSYALIDRALQDALAAAGFGDVRPVHAPVFQAVAALPAATVSAIAEATGVTKQHVSQLVAELEELGYLSRHPAPGDARLRLVRFTERGQAAVRAAARATVATEAAWAQVLGTRRLHALVGGLRTVVDHAVDPEGAAVPGETRPPR